MGRIYVPRGFQGQRVLLPDDLLPAGWNPSMATGMTDILDYRQKVTLVSGNLVSQWSSAIGARYVLQSTAGMQPTFTGTGVTFAGNQILYPNNSYTTGFGCFATAANQASSNAATILICANWTDNTVPGDGSIGSFAGMRETHQGIGAIGSQIGFQSWITKTNVPKFGSGMNDGRPRLFGWYHRGASDMGGATEDPNGELYIGPDIITSTLLVAVASYIGLRIGNLSANPWLGEVKAVFCASGRLSDLDRKRTHRWCQVNFGAV